MSIQCLSDSVNFTAPSDTQPDYQAQINIMFNFIQDSGTTGPYLYTVNLTGSVDQPSAIIAFDQARPLITNQVLIAYAQANLIT
jgi:hypothetical protein